MILQNLVPIGKDRPIAFASKTQAQGNQNYSHLKKDVLAVIFRVKKFNEYYLGRLLTHQTDHKPLLGVIKVFRRA